MNKNLLVRGAATPRVSRTLMSTLKDIPLSPLHRERLELIDNHDFTGVKRKMRADAAEHLSEGYLEEGILALKQYYAVALLDPKNEHAVADRVDPFWHPHILHTRQYTLFCEQVFGQYIHHEPLDRTDAVARAAVARRYKHSSRVYDRLFRYINRKFFPRNMPDIKLVCTHYEVHTPEIREVALFQGADLSVPGGEWPEVVVGRAW